LPVTTYTDAFTRSLLDVAKNDDRVVALTAAMAGPTGLLAFAERYPERFIDCGIAEQHEMTSAAGMAMGGLRPVVAVYSTFFTRAFDQAFYDVGLHQLPVTIVLDRAGVTGDDGASHHGVLDLELSLSIPNMTVFAPSSADEVGVMMQTAMDLPGPATIRFPKTPPVPLDGLVGEGLKARRLRSGDRTLCLLGVGKMTQRAFAAASLLDEEGMNATVYDVRVVSPADPAMIADALAHSVVLTIEDGVRLGGAGTHLIDAIRSLADRSGGPMPAVRVLGTPRRFLAHGAPDDILSELGLDAAGIAASALRTVRGEPEPAHAPSVA